MGEDDEWAYRVRLERDPVTPLGGAQTCTVHWHGADGERAELWFDTVGEGKAFAQQVAQAMEQAAREMFGREQFGGGR